MKRNTPRLLLQIIKTEFFLRDQGTFLGFLWTLLNPLFLFVTLYVVFSRSLGAGSETFKGYLLTGILLWNFFATATSSGASILIRRSNYIGAAPLPPGLFIVGSIAAVLLSSLCEAAIGFLYLASTITVTVSMILQYCGGIMILSVLSVGVASLLSIIRVFFADAIYLWGMLLRIGFFLTPVFYTVSTIDPQYAHIVQMNPLTSIFGAARAELSPQIPGLELLPMVVIGSLILAIVGLYSAQLFRYRYIEG